MLRLLLVLTVLLVAPLALAQGDPLREALVERAEALTDALLVGDTETLAADFNPQMRAALPPEKLAGVVSTLTAQLGEPQERFRTRVEAQPPITTVIVTQQFERAAADVQISFDADSKVAGLFVRPVQPAEGATSVSSPYADSTRYRAEEMRVDAGIGLPLGGTLLVPEGEGRVPGVVLVHGSGPSDRDGTVGPNKPLRDLAAGFASEGIAALRFDKRTAEHPGWFADRTYTVADESIDDALAALDVLRQHPDVDPEQLFVVGHSLGGTIAPRIAHRAAEEGTPVAGVVVHAGRDYQVTDADFAVWQTALAADPDATLRRYPLLNHLLIAGEGPSTPAEYQRQEFVDATLVGETAAWIRDR